MPDESATLQDVFRVVNEMREEMRAGFKAAAGERAELKEEIGAVRDVVDNELASQSQVNQLEQGQRDILRRLRKIEKEKA